MKRTTLGLSGLQCLILFATTMGCGGEAKRSHVKAITDPADRPIEIVESFWLYENNKLIEGAWTDLPDSNLKFFPELMPTTLRDYFWVADKNVSVKLVPEETPHHREGTVPRIEFPAAGGAIHLTFQHDLFDQIDVTRTDYNITPVFEIRAKKGDSLHLKFVTNLVCYRIDAASGAFDVLDPSVYTSEKNVTITYDLFEPETHKLATTLTNSIYAEAKRKCDLLQGEAIATNFSVDIESMSLTAPAKVDFTGIFIKRSVPN